MIIGNNTFSSSSKRISNSSTKRRKQEAASGAAVEGAPEVELVIAWRARTIIWGIRRTSNLLAVRGVCGTMRRNLRSCGRTF